jgi:hypothetical protein
MVAAESRWQRWGATVIAALVFLLALRLAFSRAIIAGAVGSTGRHLSIPEDFANIVYFPARALLAGVCPYDASSYLARFPAPNPAPPYLPGLLLLHLPLGTLTPVRSAEVYRALSVGLLLLLAYAALTLSGAKAAPPPFSPSPRRSS